jgi:hypothetical protein
VMMMVMTIYRENMNFIFRLHIRKKDSTCLLLYLTPIKFAPKHCMGTRWSSGWGAVSIPDGVIEIFHWHNTSGRTMTFFINIILPDALWPWGRLSL